MEIKLTHLQKILPKNKKFNAVSMIRYPSLQQYFSSPIEKQNRYKKRSMPSPCVSNSSGPQHSTSLLVDKEDDFIRYYIDLFVSECLLLRLQRYLQRHGFFLFP